ncbi:hypothetical protein KFL_003710140 [Klebsormidium nitens]|uniref:Uncharacterized protein n=1 Tax=Klebsormidium nitens TaxID=105231 RepID=A0A1Y1IHU4_KLENI|nr:hypothetical protein KFL_003710140 [Klebsormidium nitens]|eukprot:GAQ87708.1 hypothetical protein KFL_003710140 [Klebsormidium nitens]
MEGGSSGPGLLLRACGARSNLPGDNEVLIPRLTEWAFADLVIPAAEEGEVNFEMKRVTALGKHADLPARLRPIVWRNVGKGVGKSRAWKALLEAHTRRVAAETALPKGRSSALLPTASPEILERGDQLQWSQRSTLEHRVEPTSGVQTGRGGSGETVAPRHVENAVRASGPSDGRVLKKAGATNGGDVASCHATGTAAEAEVRRLPADACGRQANGCGRQSVGSSRESGGQERKADGCGQQADACREEANRCRPETDGCGRQPGRIQAAAKLPTGEGRNRSVGSNPLGGRRAAGSAFKRRLGEDEAKVQRVSLPSNWEEAGLQGGAELKNGFAGSQKLSRKEELSLIWPNSAPAPLPCAKFVASGEETLERFGALLEELQLTGKCSRRTGPFKETWDKDFGTRNDDYEIGRASVAHGASRWIVSADSVAPEANKESVIALAAYTEITLNQLPVKGPRGSLSVAVPPTGSSLEEAPIVRTTVPAAAIWGAQYPSPKNGGATAPTSQRPLACRADDFPTEYAVGRPRQLHQPSEVWESGARLEPDGAAIGEAKENGTRFDEPVGLASLELPEVSPNTSAAVTPGASARRENGQPDEAPHVESPSSQQIQQAESAAFRPRKLPPGRRNPGVWHSLDPLPTPDCLSEHLPVDGLHAWPSAGGCLTPSIQLTPGRPSVPLDARTSTARQHEESHPLAPVQSSNHAVEKFSGSFWQQFPGLGDDGLGALRDWPDRNLERRTGGDTGVEAWKAFDDIGLYSAGISEVLMDFLDQSTSPVLRKEPYSPLSVSGEGQQQAILRQRGRASQGQGYVDGEGEGGFGARVSEASNSKRRRIDWGGTVPKLGGGAQVEEMRGDFAACVMRFAKGFVS